MRALQTSLAIETAARSRDFGPGAGVAPWAGGRDFFCISTTGERADCVPVHGEFEPLSKSAGLWKTLDCVKATP